MGKKMRQAVKLLSKRLQQEPANSSSGSEENDAAVEISPTLVDELLCFLILCLENQKKIFAQSSAIDQLQAALPKITSSPHASLLDRLCHALQHPLKYQKLTILLHNEIETSSSPMINGTVILTEEQWGKVQQFVTVLVQHYEDEPLLYVILVRTILNRESGKVPEAVQWARNGVKSCDKETPEWLSDLLKRALAVSLSTAAAHAVLSSADRQSYRSEATEILMELSQKHKEDSLILYNLAVLLADCGKFSAATKAIKASMAGAQGSLDPAWALYALLLSTNRDYDGALTAIEGGLTDCSPLHEPLLQIIKAQLMMSSGFPNEGISVLSAVCSRFKTELMNPESTVGMEEIHKRQQGMLWKELMELYLSQGRTDDAKTCVEQMEKVRACTPDFLYMNGRVHQEMDQIPQAIQFFEMALSIDPNHEATTLALGKLYLTRGKTLLERGLDGSSDLVLSQSLISNIIQVLDPDNYIGWYNLGLVCKAQSRYEEAKRHLQYATSVASISPVKGFKFLPRLL